MTCQENFHPFSWSVKAQQKGMAITKFIGPPLTGEISHAAGSFSGNLVQEHYNDSRAGIIIISQAKIDTRDSTVSK
jgi:hypothetical protein